LELITVTSRPSTRALALVQGLSQMVLGLAIPTSVSAPLSRLITTFWGPQVSIFVSRRTLRALSCELVKAAMGTIRFTAHKLVGSCSYRVSQCVGAVKFRCNTHAADLNTVDCPLSSRASPCVVVAGKVWCSKHPQEPVALFDSVYKCVRRTYTCKRHKTAIKCEQVPVHCGFSEGETISFASRSEALAMANDPSTTEENRNMILEMCEPPSAAHAALYKIYDNLDRLDRFMSSHPQLTHMISDLGITGYLTLFDQPEPSWSDVITDPRRLLEDPRSWTG